MADLTTREWFERASEFRQELKEAVSGEYDEYHERYEEAVDDLDHALRRACNRFRRILRHKNRRKKGNVSGE